MKVNNKVGEIIPIVDGHLDIAENVTVFKRDLTKSIKEIRLKENRTINQVTVTVEELQKGNIAICFATVTPGFLVEDVGPDFEPKSGLYNSPKEAQAQAMSQIDLYEKWEQEERIRIIKSKDDLEDHLKLWKSDKLTGIVMLMEGADPIVKVSDLNKWWDRGLRMIGLTFGNTKYGMGVAGGREIIKDFGLTPEGIELLKAMAEIGMIWDISHLTEKGMWQGLNLNVPNVCASHANAQKLTPTSRHLSDEIIKAIANKNGVIGLVLYNGFLDLGWKKDRTRKVTLRQHLKNQAEYLAELVGWDHVGIGSDLDGGFGSNEVPEEIDTIADLHKIGQVVPFNVKEDVLGNNWIRFLKKALP